MISPKLKEIAKEYGWYYSKNCVFGQYNDYYFQMNEGPGFKKLTSYFNEIDNGTKEAIKQNLIEKKKELRLGEITINNNSLSITFNEQLMPIKREILKTGLEYVVRILHLNSVKVMNKCFQCNGNENLKYFYNHENNLSKMLCQNCVDKNENDNFQKEKMKMYDENRYLMGLIGAFIFSLLGIIAWVILSYYFQTITSFGAILLGLLSFQGYKYFKGTMNNIAKWSLLAMIIISIILANYISAGFEIYNYNEGISFSDIVYNLLYNSAISSIVFQNILISLLLGCIPFYYIIKYFNKNMGLSKWLLADKIKN